MSFSEERGRGYAGVARPPKRGQEPYFSKTGGAGLLVLSCCFRFLFGERVSRFVFGHLFPGKKREEENSTPSACLRAFAFLCVRVRVCTMCSVFPHGVFLRFCVFLNRFHIFAGFCWVGRGRKVRALNCYGFLDRPGRLTIPHSR